MKKTRKAKRPSKTQVKKTMAWLFGADKPPQALVISCSKSGYLATIMAERGNSKDLIDTVWGFCSYHWKMVRAKVEADQKIAIVVVRGDGHVLSFGPSSDASSSQIPKNRKAVAIYLDNMGFI